MLAKHVLTVMNNANLSDVQRQELIELLLSIKGDGSLLSEFNSASIDTLKESLESDSGNQGHSTFADLELSIYDEIRADISFTTYDGLDLEFDLIEEIMDTDHGTYEGLLAEFDLIEEIVDNKESSTEIESSEDEALNESPTGAFPIPMASESENMLGRYIDLGLLGQGGMGEVRKVHDVTLKRNLAMKIVHPSMLTNQNAISRFTEEAQVGAQLQHPNIIPIHEFGELDDGRLYFTMTQIKGREFSEFIRGVHTASDEHSWNIGQHGTTFRQLIQIFHKICETMAYAHSVGVVHRDLKPENVMIGSFGEVLVVDWGIAKVYGRDGGIDIDVNIDEEDIVHTERSEQNLMATRMGMVAGTPAYMSPEQAKGRIDLLGPASDIYTLGAILYEILSGRPPYNGTSALEIVEKVRSTPPPSLLTPPPTNESIDLPDMEPLDTHQGKIPLPLIEMCQRAMQREIVDRYQTASELATEVFNWLEGAQKRDKALKQYDAAMDLLAQAEELELRYEHLWSEANDIIEASGLTSSKNWERWIQAEETIQQANSLRQEYRSAIQGVLIYDSELEEANEAMAQLVSKDIVHAVALGEPRRRESLERELHKYLQHLPRQKQQHLLQQVEKKRNDTISLNRARCGTMLGRKKMRSQIIETIGQGSRLISIIGTAGVGKSRLALEVIHDLQSTERQTYFCDLTQARSEIGVALLVAKSMNIKLRNIDPIGQLGEMFAEHNTTLVLDNIEQVLHAGGNVITRWMEQSSTLTIIVTSRIKMRLQTEVSFSLQPLSTLESMELFAKRGQKVKSSFSLEKSNCEAIGRLIGQLDNLPLAIELAAARLNIFNVNEIEQHLKERFDLLRSRSKETQPLHAALDWSWDLLTPWAKAVLSQTSVFRGGFEVNAAEAVIQCGMWKEAPAVFDVLQDLCDDSLVVANRNADGQIRFGLMESIRQYANEQLLDENSIGHGLSGPIARLETQQRHAGHYAKFGDRAYLEYLDSSETKIQRDHFFEELENFAIGIEYGEGNVAFNCCMAALKILRMKGPVSLGVDLAASVLVRRDISETSKKELQIEHIRFLRISGRMTEARGQSSQIQQNIVAAPSQQDDALLQEQETNESPVDATSIEQRATLIIEADGLLEMGNIEEAESSFTQALTLYNEALNIYTHLNEFKGIGEAKLKIAKVHRKQGNLQDSLILIAEALELSEEKELYLLKIDCINEMGVLESIRGNKQLSLERYQEAITMAQLVGDKFREATNLLHRGILYHGLGNPDLSMIDYTRALEISQEQGDKLSESITHGNLGNLYKAIGDYPSALKHCTLALNISREVGNKRNACANLGNLANINQELGRHNEAIHFYHQARQMALEIGDKRTEAIQLGNLGLLHVNLQKYDQAIVFYEQSIQIAREGGCNMNDAIQNGNLGDLMCKLERWSEAEQHLTYAIEICNSSYPPASGAFLGSLAWVYAQRSQLTEAQEALAKGEPLIQVLPLEYAKFLCKKAKILYLLQQPQNASEAIDQARAIYEDLNATPDSEIAKAIASAELFLATPIS